MPPLAASQVSIDDVPRALGNAELILCNGISVLGGPPDSESRGAKFRRLWQKKGERSLGCRFGWEDRKFTRWGQACTDDADDALTGRPAEKGWNKAILGSFRRNRPDHPLRPEGSICARFRPNGCRRNVASGATAPRFVTIRKQSAGSVFQAARTEVFPG